MPNGKDRCIQNYGSLHCVKGKFESEEFPHSVGSADVRRGI